MYPNFLKTVQPLQGLLFPSAGDLADLIFVFFDPIGQALCKRTLTIVENLQEKHADRIRFYLSKADEAGHESDRQVWIEYWWLIARLQ